MPVQPHFTCRQDDEFLYLSIRVPHVRPSSTETHIDGRNFNFYLKPYLLKLRFPHEVVDDERCRAEYHADKDGGTITCFLPKSLHGQVFDNLDLLSSMVVVAPGASGPASSTLGQDAGKTSAILDIVASKAAEAKARAKNTRPLIEVVSSSTTVRVGEESSNRENATSACSGRQEIEADGERKAVACVSRAVTVLTTEVIGTSMKGRELLGKAAASDVNGGNDLAPKYGFGNAFSNFFKDLHGDILSEMVEIPDPDNTQPSARRSLRRQVEDLAFDRERYMSDHCFHAEDMIFLSAISFVPHWQSNNTAPKAKIDTKRSAGAQEGDRKDQSFCSDKRDDTSTVSILALADKLGKVSLQDKHLASVFTDEEKESMRRLPKTRFLSMPLHECLASLLILVDILVAYAYDHRFTCGQGSVESGWTIATLSRTLSWLDSAPELCRSDNRSELLLHCLCDAVRRTLCFPYLRCWSMSNIVIQDVANILKRGLRCTLKCILQVRRLLEKDEARYLLNKLYVDSLCVWLQQCVTDNHCVALGRAVEAIRTAENGERLRRATGWNLKELEHEAEERLVSQTQA